MQKTKKKTVLFVDDDAYLTLGYIDKLEKEGYQVVTASTGTEAINRVRERQGKFDVVILDIMMRWGKKAKNLDLERMTGLGVARTLKKEYPDIKLLGFSVLRDESVVNWFTQYGSGYIPKSARPIHFIDAVHLAVYGRRKRSPKCFIVHGHDTRSLNQLRKFLQSDMKIKDIVILRDQPNFGRTIIEKIEDYAKETDLVFILMTPDDIAYTQRMSNSKKRRARQNVIFELGYFYAQMQRTSGKILLLHKGNLELPSDISGIIYIDITDGVNSKKEALQKELNEWK